MGVKERLIDYLKFKGIGQVKFAESIGVSSGYVNNIRKSIQPDKLLSISKLYPDLNTGWLLTGEGQMLKDVEEVSLSPSSKLGAELDEYTTYLIPQYAIGGSLTGFSNDGVALQNCEKVISPIKGVDFAISVYGESMYPEYPSGSRVLIKRINPDVFIDWGKAYVLDTSNGVIIKEIHECKREGYITCHSINPDPKFADFDVPLSEIYGIYRVLMCLAAK